MSDDDDDFEIKPKKKAAPVKKAKPAVALPATDDENDAPAPVKVRFSLASILSSATVIRYSDADADNTSPYRLRLQPLLPNRRRKPKRLRSANLASTWT